MLDTSLSNVIKVIYVGPYNTWCKFMSNLIRIDINEIFYVQP